MAKLFKTYSLKYTYNCGFLGISLTVLFSMVIYIIGIMNFSSDINFDILQKNYLLSFFSVVILPITAIIITAIEIGKDFESGCGKFFLISKISKEKFLLSKIIFIFITLAAAMILTYGFTFLPGKLLFSNVTFNTQIVQGLFITYTSILAITLITAIVALISNSFQNTLIISIGIYFLMLIVDQIYPGFRYSLIFNLTNPLKGDIISCTTSLIYSLLFLLISMKIMKEKDVVL